MFSLDTLGFNLAKRIPPEKVLLLRPQGWVHHTFWQRVLPSNQDSIHQLMGNPQCEMKCISKLDVAVAKRVVPIDSMDPISCNLLGFVLASWEAQGKKQNCVSKSKNARDQSQPALKSTYSKASDQHVNRLLALLGGRLPRSIGGARHGERNIDKNEMDKCKTVIEQVWNRR